MRRRALTIWFAILAAGACGGKSSSGGDTHTSGSDGQWYRASLDLGADHPPLQFFLKLPTGDTGQAVVVNGSEELPLAYTATADKVTITADWNYESEITATRDADGKLTGQWRRYSPLWQEVILKFAAAPVDSPDPDKRFDGGKAEGSVDGYWDLTFAEHGHGRAHLSQQGDVVTGFMRPGNLGDMRFLAGNLRGRDLMLSTFNGNVANVVGAKLSEDGKTLTGEISMQNVWNEKFTGKRVDAMPEEKQAHLRAGAKTLTMPGKDKIAGGPALVIYFATWCGSCNDAFPFVVELIARHPKVKVLGLDYELNDDQKENERQLAHFRDKHKFEFEVIQVPTTPQDWAAAMPPELEGWDGLPIFAFIDAKGTIRHLWGGWYGPAAPDQNKKVRQMFETWIAELDR